MHTVPTPINGDTIFMTSILVAQVIRFVFKLNCLVVKVHNIASMIDCIGF